MIITDKAQIKVTELKESNNLRLSGSDELECYELIESDLKLPADATFTRSSVAYLSDGTQVAVDEPRFEDAGLYFDGVDDYILIDNPLIQGSDFTISFWAKLNTIKNQCFFCSRTLLGSGVAIFALTNNSIRVDTGTDLNGKTVQWKTGYDIPINTRTHIAVVKNTSGIFLYINGNLYSSTSTVGDMSNLSNIATLGISQIDGDGFGNQLNGVIYEVRIWNTALTQQQIQENMNKELTGNEPGLVGYWKLNEGTGTIAHDSTANANHGTIYGATWGKGKLGFGKAVMVEEGTTNLFTNPKLLNNGQGWTPYSSTAWVDSSGEYPYIHCEAQFDGVYQTLSLSATTYTLSYLVKHKSGFNHIGSHFDGTPTMKIRIDGGEWIDGNIITVPSDGNWHLVEIQATYTTSGSYKVYLQPGRGAVGVSEFWFKYAQLEQKPYYTSFIDGTRSPETLTIPTAGVLNKDEGTIELWINPITVQNWNNFFNMSISTGRFLLYFNNTGCVIWDYGPANSGLRTSAGVVVAGQWLHVAMRWSASKGSHELFVNGQYIGTRSFTPPDSLPATVSVVNNYGALIDDLRISNRARSDEEIAAAYASGQPLPVDEWTTYKLDFNDKVRITTQGQIICNELIEI